MRIVPLAVVVLFAVLSGCGADGGLCDDICGAYGDCFGDGARTSCLEGCEPALDDPTGACLEAADAYADCVGSAACLDIEEEC